MIKFAKVIQTFYIENRKAFHIQPVQGLNPGVFNKCDFYIKYYGVVKHALHIKSCAFL